VTRYYAEDVVAKAAWWFALLAGVLILVWSSANPDGLYLGTIQIAMLVAGKLMYPKQRLGRVEDNPFQSKTPRQRRYASNRNTTLIAIVLGLAGISIVQLLLLGSIRFGIPNLFSDVFYSYTCISSAISESYFLHWGVQTNLTTFIHRYAGLIAVPLIAVTLHSAVYGTSGALLLMVAAGFLIFALVFEYTRRLSVPLIVHLVVNVLG